MNPLSIKDVISYFNGLTPHGQQDFINLFVREMHKGCGSFENTIKKKQDHQIVVCPHCGSLHIQKRGHSYGRQRYQCIDCSRSFGATTKTPIASLKKPELFERYIKLVFERKTLKQCEAELGISHQTAFDWRHKILSGLVEHVPAIMRGVIECDEIEFRISNKGQRTNLGRKPRKRGSNYKRNDGSYNSNTVQVITAVSRTGESVMVPVKGKKVTTKQIDDSIGGKMEESSTLITDKNSAYRKFAKDNGLKLRQVKSTEHVDKNDRRIHIQHVNATHSKLRGFMGKYRGVSTKYLANYLKWFCYMNDFESMADKVEAWLLDIISSLAPYDNYHRLKNQPIF